MPIQPMLAQIAAMTQAAITIEMGGFHFLTAKVSGPQNAGPLDRRVRPEGQQGAPGLEDGRSPRKSAGPRKRRSAARMIARGACCTSAGGQKAWNPLKQGRTLERVAARIEAGDGTNERK